MDGNQKIIMIVDDNSTSLASGKEMLKDAYKVYPVPSGEILLDLLENVMPDLILLDVEIPSMNGYDVITIMKSTPQWQHIPVIFLTVLSDEQSEYKGLSLGAIDYVLKPFSAPLLRRRIENHLAAEDYRKSLQAFNANLTEMVKQKVEDMMIFQNNLQNVMTDMVEFRDDVTGGHIIRTQKYMELLLDSMMEERVYVDEIASWDRPVCVSAARLHDLGKIGISDAILKKPDKLTNEEFEIMRTHVNIGIKMIRKFGVTTNEHSFLKYGKLILAAHHERWDGQGYPASLKGLDIPLEGRLMAIADVYDALISKRPYKPPFSTQEAQSLIKQGAGTQFDPALIRVFSKISDRFADVVRRYAY